MQLSLHRTGSFASSGDGIPLEIALDWAGPRRLAVLLSGSHASSEAMWVVLQGRRVSLSDVDLYVILETHADCLAAEARAREARASLAPRLLERSLAAPLEVAFLTLAGLAALPARPATLELRRHGRVIDGDATVLDRVPRVEPDQVSAEEITLLLENRAFELLAAHALLGGGELDRMRARHATHKVALDLASVLALEHGAWPDGAAARVEWARTRGFATADLDRIWNAALEWRARPEPWAGREGALADWHNVVREWCGAWLRRANAQAPARPPDEFALALRAARRARARRRFRQAVRFEARSGHGPSVWSRWRFASRGTPQHRLNASAAVLLLGASASGPDAVPALAPRARAVLDRLGVLQAGTARDWDAMAREAVRLWDLWILDGQRSAWLA